jgi:hypothetical protein
VLAAGMESLFLRLGLTPVPALVVPEDDDGGALVTYLRLMFATFGADGAFDQRHDCKRQCQPCALCRAPHLLSPLAARDLRLTSRSS